jgi:hypothetical protein
MIYKDRINKHFLRKNSLERRCVILIALSALLHKFKYGGCLTCLHLPRKTKNNVSFYQEKPNVFGNCVVSGRTVYTMKVNWEEMTCASMP